MYKTIVDNFVISVSKNNGNYEITETEYNEILDLIRNKPTAPEGYGYRLKTDLTWELYELPEPEPIDEEATIEDYETALAELGVK